MTEWIPKRQDVPVWDLRENGLRVVKLKHGQDVFVGRGRNQHDALSELVQQLLAALTAAENRRS